MNKFDFVPIEHQQEIIKLEAWLQSLQRGLPRGDDKTRYLFEIYNEYFAGSTLMEESCAACLGKVLRATNQAIEYYKTK